MRKGTLALALFLLLTFASHGVWCAAAVRSAMAKEDAAHRHHLRPHRHETQGERISTARKVGRMAGSSGAGSSSSSGRNTGGVVAETGPHNTKNGGTVALPAAATSALALVFTATVLLSALSF